MEGYGEAVFATEYLCKEYRHTVALRDVSITIPRGQIYGLIGENGAGKTTLLRILCGLTRPTRGRLLLFGAADAARQSEMRRRMGCLVDGPALYADLTAWQNLKVQCLQRGLNEADIAPTLQLVGLKDTGSKPAGKFSLGMRQRLGLAVALLGKPEFLVLDEPLNGLDPMGIQELRHLLEKLNREQGMTILLSSHILSELHQLATSYGILHNGQLLEQLTAEELDARCSKYLLVRTDNDRRAVDILRKMFPEAICQATVGAFLALASVLTLWLKNHAAAALVTSILPLAGVLLYQVQYEDFSTQPLLIQLAAKAMPTYYWSRLCALNITPQFCVELVAWVIVALAVAAGLGWMALHRPDAGKQRSARKPHAVLRRREKSAARQGMHRASTFSAALYALRCTRLPGMLALFGLLCMAFALEVSESRIVDATWADGRRVGIFPGGSLPVGSAADAALGTVLSVGILAWIAVILVAVMAFHQNKTAGAARLAVAYGVSRVRYMVGSFAAETIMLQGWYMVLYFLLSVVTGSLFQPGRTAFFWMQSAWILQASYAVVWLVCRLCGSELAGATFCFVVTLAGVIVSVSAPDPAAVSPLSALLFYATPMPYWLALGGGHSIPWQAVGYGAGVTALCLAAALAITTVRDVE